MPNVAASPLFRLDRPLRVTPAFELHRALTDDGPAVLVRASTPSDASDEALDRLARGHEAVRHPRVPRARAITIEGGRRAVLLACDVDHDGILVVRRLAASGKKLPWAAGDWFIDALRDALLGAHRATLEGAPVVLGRLGFGNVLFSTTGAFFVVGFGANAPLDNEHGALVTADPVFCAPEIAAGGVATPSSDLVATLMLKRSLAPLVDLPGPLSRALRGEIDDESVAVLELATWFDSEVVAQVPPRRPPIDEVLAAIARFRDLLDVGLDRDGFESRIAQELDGSRPMRTLRTLAIDPLDHELSIDDGPRVRVGPALFRVLHRVARDRAGASTHDLLEAGWPGESPVGGSGEGRVYAAIKRLRQLGLTEMIEHTGGQYRIASTVRVAVAS
ncbi:MAG: hypothetical protein J0L92_01800 [Deltaproteobacteria bacterium]|nr:hypothetical protein [Deltaproteobacteria bacterium]